MARRPSSNGMPACCAGSSPLLSSASSALAGDPVARVRFMAAHRRSLPVVASSATVALWSIWWAWHMWPDSGLSWHFSVDGARMLVHGSGLRIFADAPWLQTGPLSLVLAAALSPLPANVGKGAVLVAMTAAGP